MNPLSIDSFVIDDADLVIAARTGDIEAFGQLVNRYERSARATCWAILQDSHHAAQGGQRAGFVYLLRNQHVLIPVSLQKLRGRLSFSAVDPQIAPA